MYLYHVISTMNHPQSRPLPRCLILLPTYKTSCFHLMHVTCRFSIKLKSKIARYWNCCSCHDVVSVCDFVYWIQSSQHGKAVTTTLSLCHLNVMNMARFAFKGHFPHTLYKAVREDTAWENKWLVVSRQSTSVSREERDCKSAWPYLSWLSTLTPLITRRSIGYSYVHFIQQWQSHKLTCNSLRCHLTWYSALAMIFAVVYHIPHRSEQTKLDVI